MLKLILKIFISLVLIILILTGGFLAYLFTGKVEVNKDIQWGVTFSQKFAEKMGLDWRETYLAILDDLGVKRIRLVAYWDKIEPQKGEFNFNDLDWQIQQAQQKNIPIILAVGQRLPRWPECHIPKWASSISKEKKQKQLLQFIKKTINRYEDKDIIKYWQIENEPFLHSFGHCPELDEDFLDKEIALAKQLSKKQIILTVSGELSLWTPPAKRADVLGTSLYRQIWNEEVGYFTYPIPSIFYHKRAELVKKMTGVNKIIIIELQGEPWGEELLYGGLSYEKQIELMNIGKFKEIVNYTKRTGYDTAYFWGAEWWYWLKTEKGNDKIWRAASKIM